MSGLVCAGPRELGTCPRWSVILYCSFAFEKYICLSAQNGVNPDWEKKVIEYFKGKLKENNAPKWVSLLSFFDFHFLSTVLIHIQF